MKQHDVAARARVQNVADDGFRPGLGPILGVDVESRRDVTEIGRKADRHQLVRRRRLGVSEVRWAEEQRAAVEHRLEQPLGRIQLEPSHEGGCERQIGVGERVIAHLVALGHDLPQQRDVALGVHSDHKERRRRPPAPEGIEDHRRPGAVGSVVERQRDLVRRGPVPADDPG